MLKDPYTLILAPNASLMTGPGTNTIVLGGGVEGATVIDPGDDNHEHLEAIIKAGEERGRIRRILITHGHPDHQGGAQALREKLGIYIYAFSRQGVPIADEEVSDGSTFPADNDTLRAIHTPGHRFDHLSFLLEQQRIFFAGDLIAGTGSVVIIPPEGDMLDYLNTLKHLQNYVITEIVPAHGPIITDPQAKISAYITHRLQREKQILTILQNSGQSYNIMELVQQIYTHIDHNLYALAALSVEAHLIKLEREGKAHQGIGQAWSSSNHHT